MSYREMHARRIDALTMQSLQMAADLAYLIEKSDDTLNMFAKVERRSENRMSDKEFYALIGRAH